jgi:hypothetical protein
MPSRPALTVASLLWATSFTTLGMASVLLRADRDGVVGIVLGSILLGIVCLVTERRTSRFHPRGLGPILLFLVFAAVVEGVGFLTLQTEGERNQSYWFASAFVFAMAGLVIAFRGEPSDGVLTTLISFHVMMLVPFVGIAVPAVVALIQGTPAARIESYGPLVGRLMGIESVIVVPLFVTLCSAVLAVEFYRPFESRVLSWSVHLVGLAGFGVMLARWASEGL